MDKSKVMCIERNKEPLPLNRERMEVVNSVKYLGICFSRDGGVKDDVSMRVG